MGLLERSGLDPESGPSVMRNFEPFQDRGFKSAGREVGRRKAA
jgi:hypothetical protein